VQFGEADTDDATKHRDRSHDDYGSRRSPKLLIGEGKERRGQASADGDKCSPPKRGVPPNLRPYRLGGRGIGEHDRNDEPGYDLRACRPEGSVVDGVEHVRTVPTLASILDRRSSRRLDIAHGGHAEIAATQSVRSYRRKMIRYLAADSTTKSVCVDPADAAYPSPAVIT
jgi:hypothetical protein